MNKKRYLVWKCDAGWKVREVDLIDIMPIHTDFIPEKEELKKG